MVTWKYDWIKSYDESRLVFYEMTSEKLDVFNRGINLKPHTDFFGWMYATMDQLESEYIGKFTSITNLKVGRMIFKKNFI